MAEVDPKYDPTRQKTTERRKRLDVNAHAKTWSTCSIESTASKSAIERRKKWDVLACADQPRNRKNIACGKG
jgi:hypothetical protein